jgi:2-phospho-L-lactate guanylyltransferase (CobY/MobA/RfbA family)
MPQTTTEPTLLVFTLGAPAERARRPLLGRRLGAVEVALRRACLDEALAAGRAAGLRLAVCSPRPLAGTGADETLPQGGGGFGERLAGAIEEAFARGASPLLVVGTDTPGLAAAHLEAALALLAADRDRVVIGPSPDGGFYLLAASRPIPDLATAVRWCGPETLATLRAALAAAGRPVALLPPLADLDRPADLAGWLAAQDPNASAEHVALATWRPHLRRLLAAMSRPPRPRRERAPRQVVALAPTGRAPPLLASEA